MSTDETTMREELATLRLQRSVLREKLAARVKLDNDWHVSMADCVFAVAKNISTLDNDKRERVLLAVAVLYGIIKPGAAEQSSEGGKP
jgi:hypothetical protein